MYFFKNGFTGKLRLVSSVLGSQHTNYITVP
jgi:hypothetical protein